jgi:hypothetical protein
MQRPLMGGLHTGSSRWRICDGTLGRPALRTDWLLIRSHARDRMSDCWRADHSIQIEEVGLDSPTSSLHFACRLCGLERGVTAEWRDPEDFRSELPSATHRGEAEEAFRASMKGRADEVVELAGTKYGAGQ